jgi:phosphopantothenoylcysteine decarboxylase/phosphopantothenate--cysteine ligase
MSRAERSGGRVVLAVSGGIAAYKAVEVMRGFQAAGLDVHACLTEAACRFVTPLTFAAISGHPVSAGRLGDDADAQMAHVDVTRDALLFVAAPATADLIGKLACGIADDWVTTHFVACEAPLRLAPAMNQRMWRHPAVQANVATLVARGAQLVVPEEGELACGEVGPGRLAPPERIVARGLEMVRVAGGSWKGRRVLVTSGPTHEDVDPVRFVGNRSSGKMGHAIAAEAARRGAEVTLVSGPVAVETPAGCRVVRVRSAEDMAEAVAKALPGTDVAFFAAAVADFRPDATAEQKLRREDRQSLELVLVRTRDVLAESVAAATGAFLVGFAAETESDLSGAARRKLAAKRCDLLVANAVGGARSAFDADDNEVVIAAPDGSIERVPRAPKREVARKLLDAVHERLATVRSSSP